MSETAEKTDPKLWDKVKRRVTKSAKGGKPGEWSARKAQLAVHDYKAEGGGYEGGKSDRNSLHQWTEEDWGTKSGKASGTTGERYLPREAREHLTKEEYDRTTAKKRRDTKKGEQFSAQPEDVAKKAAPFRRHGHEASKAELYEEAKTREIRGRSSMTRAQLQKALAP